MDDRRSRFNHRIIEAAHGAMPREVNGVLFSVCKWCREPIAKLDGSPNRRRLWHPDCLDIYMAGRSPAWLRALVWSRDRGVCANCEDDTTTSELIAFLARYRPEDRAHMAARRTGSLWQADHIEPLTDDGSFALDNVQTLCTACHAGKTAMEAEIRASVRRGERFSLQGVLRFEGAV